MARQPSPFAESITLISHMLAGALAVGPRSSLVKALRAAREAICHADLATAGWRAVEEHNDISEQIMDDLDRHGSSIYAVASDDVPLLHQSCIDDEVYRLQYAGHEWIVRVTTEGGYGDDGTDTRQLVEELMHGEVVHD